MQALNKKNMELAQKIISRITGELMVMEGTLRGRGFKLVKLNHESIADCMTATKNKLDSLKKACVTSIASGNKLETTYEEAAALVKQSQIQRNWIQNLSIA